MDGVDFTLLCPGKVGDGRCLCIGRSGELVAFAHIGSSGIIIEAEHVKRRRSAGDLDKLAVGTLHQLDRVSHGGCPCG